MRTCFIIESNKQKRVKGIEPLFIAWKAIVLPLNYTRWVHFKAYLVFKLEISASLWCSRLLSLSSVPVSLIQRLTVYFKFEPKVVRLRSTFVLFPSHTTNIAMIGEKGKCFHKTLTLCNSRLRSGTVVLFASLHINCTGFLGVLGRFPQKLNSLK